MTRRARRTAVHPRASRMIVAVAVGTMALSPARAQTTAAVPQQPALPFEVPAWMFPTSAAPPSPVVDSVAPLHVPGSRAAYTALQIRDLFTVPDWHPGTHPPMPPVVAHGRKPAVRACAYCHLANGLGRPENAMLAGLPPAYFAQQVADIKSRARQSAWKKPYGPSDTMRQIADSATEAEVAVAARYFSRLRARQRSRVVEATDIPRVSAENGLYFPAESGGVEPLGRRLIEVALEPVRHLRHDPSTPYVAYVPPGSIARGRALAMTETTNGAKPCSSCHGPQLRGVGLVPPIAGRAPSYILRQLVAFKTGARATPASGPMRDVVAALSIDDMIAASAYAGSRKP